MIKYLDKNLPEEFSLQNGLKQGEALAPLLLIFVLEHLNSSLQI